MKVAVRPLKGDSFEVEFGAEVKVEDLKKQIEALKPEMPAGQQKLIYSGKILADGTAVSEYGIKEGEFVVVMVTKVKAPAAAAAPETAAQPAPAAPAQAPAAATAPAAAPTPAPAPDVPMSYDTAASSLVTGSAMESTITQLMEMGFEREQVERCLQAAFNNPDRAVDYLMSGIPEGILQPPAGAAGEDGGAAPPAAGAAPPSGAAPPPATAATGGGGAGGLAFPAMGAAGGGGGGGGVAEVPPALAELRNHPQFVQLAQMVMADPQRLPAMMQAVTASQPELARAIGENPEAFMQMLQAAGSGAQQDPVAQMMAAGGAGGAPPGATVVRLTEDERAAVERLMSLGFDRNAVLQAYLACDKNEELAANFLFDNPADAMGD